MKYHKPFVIAEVGCNHKGDLQIAKEFIRIASEFCSVDAVKFQKRSNRELLTEEQYNAPHPNPENSYGRTYGEHRERLEFSLEQHEVLKRVCEENNVLYSSSVWDLTSAKEICSLGPRFVKIPSACNTNDELISWICSNYQGEIHVSLGMTSREEESSIVKKFVEMKRQNDLVLYSCTSGYPVPFEDISLLEISRLSEEYGATVKEIGFSGHHLGIAVDIAAYSLGACILERHFTLDRTWKGTDHAASLEPDGMRKLKRNLDAVHKALTYKKQEILEIEEVQRAKLKYRI